MRLAVLFKILPGVFEPYLVLLQETVKFVTRLKTQDTAELGGGEFAFAISFERDGFEGCAGQILTRLRQGNKKLVGNVEGELHCLSIAARAMRCGAASGLGGR